jgi:hypothetical protein
MVGGASEDERDRLTPRWQISLRGLIFLVLAAGVSSGVVRSAREFWGNRLIEAAGTRPGQTTPSAAGWSPVPVERTAGLVLELEAVFFVLILARQLSSLFRSDARRETRHPRALFSIAWRISATGLLLWFLSMETSVLRLDYLGYIDAGWRVPGWGWVYSFYQNLMPVCGALVMLGLALGMGAGSLFDEPPGRRRRPWWLFVPLAALAAVLLAGQSYVAVIPNLVLVALEAVTNAMRHRLVAGPGLAARLVRAGSTAVSSLALTLPLALAVARDFERARRNEPWARTWQACVARLLLLAAAAATGVYLACVTLPAIDLWLPQGFAYILGAGQVFTIVVAFAVLAAGLAARSLDRHPAPERPRWLSRTSSFVRWGMLALVSLALLTCLPSTAQFDPRIPSPVTLAIDVVGRANAWLWGRFPDSVVMVISPWLAPERLAWTLMLLGVAILLVELALRPQSAEHGPFDRVVGEPQSILRFGWLVVGLTCVCLVALPTLLIAGQALWHIRLCGWDWVNSGWPR